MMTLERIEIIRQRHRFCGDSPPPIEDLDEARLVLTDHSGHGGRCLQFAAAMRRTSTPMS